MRLWAVAAVTAAWLGTAGAAQAQDFTFYMGNGYGDDIYSEPIPDIAPYPPYAGEFFDEPLPPLAAAPKCHHQRHRPQPDLSFGYGEPPPIPFAEIPEPGYGSAPYDQAYIDPGYGGPYQPPRRHKRRTACVPGEVVKQRLVSQGWGDFRDPVKGTEIVQLTARRPGGLTYRLSLDRCTGVIVSADLISKRKKRRKHVSYKDSNDSAGGSPAY